MNNMHKIISGNFAIAEGQQGNFTARTATDGFFIHKNLMASMGWTKDADLKDASGKFKPFWVVTKERDIFPRDKDGNLTTVAVKRIQATSIFLSREEMLEAINESDKLRIDATTELNSYAKSAGLDEKTVSALLTAAV